VRVVVIMIVTVTVTVMVVVSVCLCHICYSTKNLVVIPAQAGIQKSHHSAALDPGFHRDDRCVKWRVKIHAQ